MRKLRMSLMVLTLMASLTLGMVGMAEARNHHNNSGDKHYSRGCKSNNHHNYMNPYNNYNRGNKPHRAHYVKPRPARHYVEPRRAQYVRQHRRHHNHDRYLYPVLIGTGVGLLVLGLAH